MSSSLKDFKVLAQLGKGSYGSVMKVERIRDGGIYAMKEVNIRRLSPREREDAVNEIRILASIKSRNIVRYCDAFVERDNLYIIMEFAEGGDIGRQIEKFKKANKYIKEDTIWSYCIQICRALLEMHSRNILHRDLKPKNVFLTGKNHVRLGDLGCAKLMKTGLARTQIGTPYYMSPEIWNNRPYDSKSDVWALGCLLFELAMLVPPFLANDMNGLALKVKTTAPSRISKHYSDDLANLVASMLNKDPRMRPDVRQILTNPAVTARLSAVPDGDDTAWAGDEMRTALLNTIKVPASFGVVPSARPGSGGLALPPASYPIQQAAAPAPAPAPMAAAPQMLRRADSAPEMLGARPTTPPPASAAAPMMAPRPSMMAMAGAGAAAPAAPAPRVASFAAATSPPQLGRPAALQRQGSAPDVLMSNENAYAAQLKALAAAAGAGAGALARPPSSGGMGMGMAAAAPAVKPLVSVPSSRNMMNGAAPAPSAGYPGAGLAGIAAAKAAAAAVPSRPPVSSAMAPVPSAYGAAAAAVKLSAAAPVPSAAAGGLVKRPSFAVPSAGGAVGLYGAGARPSSAAGGIAPLYAAAPSAGVPRYSAMGAGLANAAAAGAAAAGGRHLMRGL